MKTSASPARAAPAGARSRSVRRRVVRALTRLAAAVSAVAGGAIGAEAAPFTANDPAPWAISAYISGNDDPTRREIFDFLGTVLLPDGRVFDVALPMTLQARALDAGTASSEGARPPGWLQRSCFDGTGATVVCNEANNGFWWHQGGIAEQVYVAVYKSGRGFVVGVHANAATGAGVPAYDGGVAPNPTTVIYNTGGSVRTAARYFADGDDTSLLGLEGRGLSHLSIYTIETAIPAPPAVALLLTGAAAMAALRRRRSRS